jgi:hypothetical protein
VGDALWRTTTIYEDAQTGERYKTWDKLKDICGDGSIPWLCLGDFHEVLRNYKHEGVGHRTLSQIQGFRDAVDVCNLIDLGYKGHFWTWEKKVTGGSYTRVILDRALGFAEWSAQFPRANVCIKALKFFPGYSGSRMISGRNMVFSFALGLREGD